MRPHRRDGVFMIIRASTRLASERSPCHTGIIRDIMQNHLLQVLVLCAMEPPASDAPSDIQKAKVEVLKAMSIPSLDDAFLAQYTEDNFMSEPGYLEDPGVPDDSVTPTFAAIVLKINNERWRGVPFVMKAGKGLDERLAEVRVRYKSQPYNKLLVGPQAKNELVCRIQPDEVPSGVLASRPSTKKRPPFTTSRGDDHLETARDAH